MIKNKKFGRAAWLLAALMMTFLICLTFKKTAFAADLSWREGVGINGSGADAPDIAGCISTDFIAPEGPILTYDVHDYPCVELRIYEYDVDRNFLNRTLISGNQRGKCVLQEETEFVKLMLADWKSGPVTAAFSEGTSFTWQQYEKPTYYFAADGDDGNPGTEAAPKKDPRPYIEAGDVIVHLRGGDVFPYSLHPGSNTEISNYGSGFAIIDGSRQTEDVFHDIGGGLYEINLSGDVGCVWLENQDPNWKKLPAGSELAKDGEYSVFHDEGKIRMRSDTDLTGQHLYYSAGESGIEVSGASDVRIMYLDVRNWGWHGIEIMRSQNVSVSECEIETIGGGQIHGTDDGPRFGNGLQVSLYGCRNVKAFQNIITDCYDSGMTPQTWSSEKGDGIPAEEILFDRNYVQRCFWCFEYATGEAVGLPSRISCRGNLFMDAEDITGGYRWDGSMGPAFFCIGTADAESSMVASGNNCMGQGRYGIMYYTWADASKVFFSGNNFILSGVGAENVRTEYKYHADGDSWENAWPATGDTEEGAGTDDEPEPAEEAPAADEPDESAHEEPATPETAEKESGTRADTSIAGDVRDRSEWAAAYKGGTKWEAGHAWMKDGSYIEIPEDLIIFEKCRAKECISAMPPECPIRVTAGEEWHIKTNLWLGGTGYTAVIILDDENVPVYVQENTNTPEDGIRVTVPEGGSKLYITCLCGQPFALEKAGAGTDEEAIMSMILSTRKAEAPESRDRACIAFVVDDSRKDLDVYADLFIEKDVPLCCAVFPENMRNGMSKGGRTVSDVLRQVEAAGGEVICHSATPVTAENQEDTAFMLHQFAWHRQTLDDYGFDVNGILLAGGEGSDTIDRSVTGKWAELFYAYSDYGTEEPHYHERVSLKGMDLESFKARVGRAVEEKEFLSFYWHDAEDITPELLAECLDYVKSLPEDVAACVTYKDYYME